MDAFEEMLNALERIAEEGEKQVSEGGGLSESKILGGLGENPAAAGQVYSLLSKGYKENLERVKWLAEWLEKIPDEPRLRELCIRFGAIGYHLAAIMNKIENLYYKEYTEGNAGDE